MTTPPTDLPDFAPTDLAIAHGHMPFTDTLGRCERELAAAYLVMTLVDLGESWDRAITFDELRASVLVHKDDEAFSWLTNPFAKPDFGELIAHGYAQRVATDTDPSIRMLPIGIERLRKCVRRALVAGGDA